MSNHVVQFHKSKDIRNNHFTSNFLNAFILRIHYRKASFTLASVTHWGESFSLRGFFHLYVNLKHATWILCPYGKGKYQWCPAGEEAYHITAAFPVQFQLRTSILLSLHAPFFLSITNNCKLCFPSNANLS